MAYPRADQYETEPLNKPWSETAHHYAKDGQAEKGGNAEPPKAAVKWVPDALQPLEAFGFPALLLVLAVAIEIAWFLNRQNKGWPTNGTPWTSGIYHLLLTYVPNLVVMVAMTQFAKIDSGIRKLQPYVDLSQGNATASKTLLLSYPSSKWKMIRPAFSNGHYLILCSTAAITLAGFALGLAPSVFVVRSTLVGRTDHKTTATNNIGLDPDWTNLAPFVTAAGYAEAAAMYGLSDPPFVKHDWVIGEIVLPKGQNGSFYASTTAIQVNAGCDPADVSSITPYSNGTGYTLTGTWSGCSATFEISSSSSIQFAAEPLLLSTCSPTSEILVGGAPEPQFQPIVFFVFDATVTSNGGVNSALAFCKPSMKIYNVDVALDLVTQGIMSINITGDYQGDNDVTGGTMKGRAFNGIVFDPKLTQDPTVLARATAAKTGLPAAVYQTAHESPGGAAVAFQGKSGPNQNESFVNLFDRVYTRYQALSAKAVYFQETTSDLLAQIDMYEERIFVITEAAQILSFSLLVLALTLTFLHYRHMVNRRNMHLAAAPGTIASTMAFTAGSHAADDLTPRDDRKDIERKLSERLYGIDPHTGTLITTETM